MCQAAASLRTQDSNPPHMPQQVDIIFSLDKTHRNALGSRIIFLALISSLA